MMRRVAPLLAVVVGCASAKPASHCEAAGDDFAMSFPAAPSVQHGHEGPFATSQLWRHRDDGGRVYEAALFTLHKTLDRRERDALLESVARGLATRARTDLERGLERGVVALGDRPALALSIAQDDGVRGRHLIGYLDARRMLQLSVVGPDDATTRDDSAAFFASFHFRDSMAPCERCCNAP